MISRGAFAPLLFFLRALYNSMDIDKKYTLFQFMGRESLGISSLTEVSKVKTIFRVASNGVSWEAWNRGSIFNAFSGFDPLQGYYLVSEDQNPNYQLYSVSESSPSGVAQVDKRYKVAVWRCESKPISEVSGPQTVYSVAFNGTSFNSWVSGSVFNAISSFDTDTGYIIFSPADVLPYQLHSCCIINDGQQVLTVGSDSSVVNGLGMTFVSGTGNKLYHEVLSDYDGLPSQLSIYVSSVQVASVTYNSPYDGTPFVFERTVGGTTTKYCGIFNSSTDRVDF